MSGNGTLQRLRGGGTGTDYCRSCNDTRVICKAGREYAIARRCPDCFEVCPDCGGEGVTWEADWTGNLVAQPCHCQDVDVRVAAYNRAGIPRRYVHCTIENLEELEDKQRAAKIAMMKVVTGFRPGDRGIGLAGKVGTGKTHLMAGLTRSLTLESGVECRFIEFSHLLDDIRAGFNAGKGSSEIVSELVEVPVLVIDELGKELDTSWQQSILDELISKRYNGEVTTFFTTNYVFDVGNWTERTREHFEKTTLADRVGSRMVSRLFEMCRPIVIDGPDYRALRAAKKDAQGR